MTHIVRLIAAGIMLLLTASTAQAGWDAFTTADVNMREGPGNRYRVIVVIPEGELVYVHSCPGSWCDVEWDSYRGYVYGRYLSSAGSGYYEDYIAPPPVIVTPGYDGGYIHIPRKRKHYDRHKRKRKHYDRHKRKRKHYDRHKRKRKLQRQKSRQHFERPLKRRKHYKRSKRRKSFERPRKRRSYRRFERHRSMHRKSRRSERRLERQRNQDKSGGGLRRRGKDKRKRDD
jgi:uncharacterized protein YraI